jgi:Tol biopolymer transport system component/DNA-binding winged helix-turn-helix (wHTH) protein
VRFGVFEVDLRSGELRKQGVRVRLQEQPFKVLAALLEHPGEIVSREQLVQRLWPDGTFVDFDRGLNAAVTRLRQVLADSAESPRYIETVARRGYRLLVPVQEVHQPGAPPPSAGRPYSVKGKWSIALCAMLVLIGAVVSLALLRTPAETKLEQITRDPGLATEPALSPDGKLLAYASDRGGHNLNLWVKQLNGNGNAVQLTHDAYDAHEPSFSPDGSRIVYRSEQEGGGIYAIPAIGGEPALLVADGRNPRFAPDGKWIAYSNGRASGEIFVIPASGGGEPRRIGADLPPGGYPVWSPDSRQLLIYASPRSGMSIMDADWWMVTLEDGAARRTGSFANLRSQGLPLQVATDVPQASVWIDDTVIFSASKGDSRSIWRVPFKRNGSVAGKAERLTLDTSLDVTPTSIGQGSVVYASVKRSMAIWSLPMQTNAAKVTGELHRLTDGEMLEATPTISPNGRMLAYGSTVLNHEDIWLKDLQTGKEVALANTPVAEWHPQISHDGSRIAYTVQDRAEHAIYVVPSTGGKATQVASESGWIFDWTPDNRYLLYHPKEGDHPDLKCLDLQSRVISSCLGKTGAYVFQSKVAPGGRWLAFEAFFTSSGDSRLYIVRAENGIPAPNADWIQVTEEHGWADKPRWSPDGNTMYFVSKRDGFLCIWAQRLDPATKHPAGAPLPIYHFHSNRLSLNAIGGGLLEIDVANDGIVMNLAEFTGNIWKLSRQ